MTTPVSDSWHKTAEVAVKEELISLGSIRLPDEKVNVSVKLGKFQNVDVGRGGAGEGSSRGNSSLEESRRRCFSMGSYEYVMDENCMLQVPINSSVAKQKKPGYRASMSECGSHQAGEGISDLRVNGGSSLKTTPSSTLQKRDSFSVSKIWLQPRKVKAADRDSSRRAFSFRLPLHRVPVEESRKKKRLFKDSEEDWEKSGSEVDLDVEVGSYVNSVESQVEEAPSFARRTLLWIVGKQSKLGSNPL